MLRIKPAPNRVSPKPGIREVGLQQVTQVPSPIKNVNRRYLIDIRGILSFTAINSIDELIISMHTIVIQWLVYGCLIRLTPSQVLSFFPLACQTEGSHLACTGINDVYLRQGPHHLNNLGSIGLDGITRVKETIIADIRCRYRGVLV